MQLHKAIAGTLCALSLTTLFASGAAAQALEYSEHDTFLVNTLQGPDGNTAYKGVIVKLGKDGEAAICFDTELCRYMAGWVKAGEEPQSAVQEPAKDKNRKAKPPEKTQWPGTSGWAMLVDPNKSTTFTASHGGPPRIRGEDNGANLVRFSTKQIPGWAGPAGGEDFTDPRKPPVNDRNLHLGPLPRDWAHWKGFYRHGDQVVLSYTVGGADVLETPGLIASGQQIAFTRTISIAKSDKSMTMVVCDVDDAAKAEGGGGGAPGLLMIEGHHGQNPVATAVDVLSASGGAALAPVLKKTPAGNRVLITIPPHAQPVLFEVAIWSGSPADAGHVSGLMQSAAKPVDPATLTKGGPSSWKEVPETKGVLAFSGTPDDAYVADTLTAPENNPYHTMLRFCGFDFFPDGHTAAISTIGGDVWIVSGIDENLEHLKWKRFATGLFQPLGLKIADGNVVVICRDGLNRLRDLDGDGEADFYENINNDCQVTTNYHEFCLDLQTDSQGNFYYSKGSPWPPDVKSDDQGTMIEVSKDGSTFKVFATGLRAPNGSGITQDDQLYTGDNEGHWTPSSKFEHLRPGKFYGMTPAAHQPPGAPAPTTFEPPVFWLPHGIDNSSGGMAFAPKDGKWGPLNGHMIVMSYGTSSLFAAMTEVVDGVEQGAAVKLPLKFGSSCMRARFNGGRDHANGDGQLYICGLKGWQTNAGRDGAFHRIRYTGKTWRMPIEFHTAKNGLFITFAEPLDKAAATDPGNWGVEQWNYKWSARYGSPEYSVKEPTKAHHDDLDVKSAKLSPDGKTVQLEIDNLAPVMQMRIRYNIKDASGKELKADILNTINKVGPERSL